MATNGNDLITGTAGADTLTGLNGNDTYTVNNANDVVVEKAGQGTDLVNSYITSYTLRDNVENLTLVGNTAVNGTGNELDNVITGNDVANVLDGGAGNDKLYGGAGNDTLKGGDGNDLLDGGTGADRLEGGAGNDIYFVDNAGDVVVENPGPGIDLINSSVSYAALPDNVEALVLTGTAAINGTGNSAGNAITGNNAANTLNGLGGIDVIIGGGGDDTLDGNSGSDAIFGGDGNDTLVYRRADNSGQLDSATGDRGIDTLRLELSSAEWLSPTVQSEVARFVKTLPTTDGVQALALPLFTFNFGTSLLEDKLVVSGIEKLDVRVKGANGNYTSIDYSAPMINVADGSGAVTEDASTPKLSDTGVITFYDVNLTNTHIASTSPVQGYINTLGGTLSVTNVATGDGSGTVTWTYSVDNAATQYLALGQTVKEQFNVTITDNTGNQATQLVEVVVTGTNDAPTITSVANAAKGAVTEDATTLTATGTLTSHDVDSNDSASWSVKDNATTGTYGSIAVNPTTGVWTYTLANGTNGTASPVQSLAAGDSHDEHFTIRVSDGRGGLADQVVTVTVTGVNDAAVLSAETKNLTETNAADDISTFGALTISDIDSPETFVAQTTALGTHYGIFAIGASGAWTYTASSAHNEFVAGTTYTDTFDVFSTDNTKISVTINILGTEDNHAPTGLATAALPAGTEDIAYTVYAANNNGINLLAGFTDIDNDPLSVNGLSADNGTVVDNHNGTFTINPASNYNGLVTLSYTVNDGLGGSVAGTQRFDLAPVTDIGGTITGVVTEAGGTNNNIPGTPTIIGIVSKDDPSDSFNSVPAGTLSDNGYGTYRMDGPGKEWTYTLDNNNSDVQALTANHTREDTFTISTVSGTTQQITITINGANDAPVITSNVATSGAVNVPENTTAVTIVSASDPEGTALTYSIVGGADQASFTLNTTTHALSFNSAPDYENPTDVGLNHNNVYNVTVAVSDGTLTANQNLTVVVTDVNEPPNPTFQIAWFPSHSAFSVPLNLHFAPTDPDSGDSVQTVKFTTVPGSIGGGFALSDGTNNISNWTGIEVGTVIDHSDFSKLTFVPDGGRQGSFGNLVYDATDSHGLTTSGALVSIQIYQAGTTINSPPNGSNNDVLVGAPNAILAGSSGADTFVFYDTSISAPDVGPVVADFSRSQGDKLDLSDIFSGTETAQDLITQGLLTLSMIGTTTHILANGVDIGSLQNVTLIASDILV